MDEKHAPNDHSQEIEAANHAHLILRSADQVQLSRPILDGRTALPVYPENLVSCTRGFSFASNKSSVFLLAFEIGVHLVEWEGIGKETSESVGKRSYWDEQLLEQRTTAQSFVHHLIERRLIYHLIIMKYN